MKLKIKTELIARHLVPNGKGGYKEVDRRRVRGRCITKAFANDIVESLRGISGGASLYSGYDCFKSYKWHGYGTGTTPESEDDTYLENQLGASWSGGSQTEGDSPNIYKSVTTVYFHGDYAITEHCLLNWGATTGVVMMDRSTFDPMSVHDGSRIEFTFTIGFSLGG